MKPFDIIDALSDLPEEYAAFAVQDHDSVSDKDTARKKMNGEIVMTNTKTETDRRTAIRLKTTGIAAVVALCLGLSGTLIYGISHMKKQPAEWQAARS